MWNRSEMYEFMRRFKKDLLNSRVLPGRQVGGGRGGGRRAEAGVRKLILPVIKTPQTTTRVLRHTATPWDAQSSYTHVVLISSVWIEDVFWNMSSDPAQLKDKMKIEES